MNYTAHYLFFSSTIHSPLITPSLSSISFSFKNCKANRFFNNFYHSSFSLVKEHVTIKRTVFLSFIATPLDISPDFQSEIIDTRLFVEADDNISSLTIIDCLFINITSDYRGAAIRIAKYVPLILNNSQFFNVVSRYEAAILFVLNEMRTWSLEPVNINYCTFTSCYSTGDNFQIFDTYSDKNPSVLMHVFLGFKYTSIEANMFELSAFNCQENKVSKKKFGAYIHLHTNTFNINFINCTNINKIDSSQVIFTQSHKQASNANYIYSSGQAGYSFIEIKDIQSYDQLTFQYFIIFNSTLFTEEDETINDTATMNESEYGIIDFGGDFSGSVVFIYCHFYDIFTDNKNYKPILSFSSNGRHPIFANCFSNVEAFSSEQGFSFGTPFQPTTYTTIPTSSKTTVYIPTKSPSRSPTELVEVGYVKKDNKKNVIVVMVSIIVPVVLTVVALIIVRKIMERNFNFIDDTDLVEMINTNNNDEHNDIEEPYVE